MPTKGMYQVWWCGRGEEYFDREFNNFESAIQYIRSEWGYGAIHRN